MPKPFRMNAVRKRGYGPPVIMKLYPIACTNAANGAAWDQQMPPGCVPVFVVPLKKRKGSKLTMPNPKRSTMYTLARPAMRNPTKLHTQMYPTDR